jgi:hypothetical protein
MNTCLNRSNLVPGGLLRVNRSGRWLALEATWTGCPGRQDSESTAKGQEGGEAARLGWFRCLGMNRPR